MKPPLPKNSRLVIYPTESSYALGCRYDDRVAIQRIMHLKSRTDHRFTLVASSLQQVKQHFKLTPAMEQLAKQYWPGAVSMVVTPKYAIRVPAVDIPKQLAKKLGAPLLATSLNVSGQPSIYDLKQLPEQFHGIPTIDGGVLPQHPPSTVVECFRGGYVVHRQGSVKL